MSITKETTARNPSVGADGGQPSKTHTLSIAETDAEFNENFFGFPGLFSKAPAGPGSGLPEHRLL